MALKPEEKIELTIGFITDVANILVQEDKPYITTESTLIVLNKAIEMLKGEESKDESESEAD